MLFNMHVSMLSKQRMLVMCITKHKEANGRNKSAFKKYDYLVKSEPLSYCFPLSSLFLGSIKRKEGQRDNETSSIYSN